VRHQGRRHDDAVRGEGAAPVYSQAQVTVEEGIPVFDHELVVPGLAPCLPDLALGITIDDQESPIGELAFISRFDKLLGVEGPIAAAAHDHDLAELERRF
jgi:hypothetical protein